MSTFDEISCGSSIWSGRGAASETESCRVESCKQSELSALGFQSLLKGRGSFWVFNAQIWILPHSRENIFLKNAKQIEAKKNYGKLDRAKNDQFWGLKTWGGEGTQDVVVEIVVRILFSTSSV